METWRKTHADETRQTHETNDPHDVLQLLQRPISAAAWASLVRRVTWIPSTFPRRAFHRPSTRRCDGGSSPRRHVLPHPSIPPVSPPTTVARRVCASCAPRLASLLVLTRRLIRRRTGPYRSVRSVRENRFSDPTPPVLPLSSTHAADPRTRHRNVEENHAPKVRCPRRTSEGSPLRVRSPIQRSWPGSRFQVRRSERVASRKGGGRPRRVSTTSPRTSVRRASTARSSQIRSLCSARKEGSIRSDASDEP